MRPPAPVDSANPDPWAPLRAATPARIGLERVGDAPALRHVLAFQHAHARARDAVHAPFDATRLAEALAPEPAILVQSRAADRAAYLRRPDLGRQLDPAAHAALVPGDYDAVFIIADGLSATAVDRHALPLLAACRERLDGWRLAPVVIASQARVALGDEIGERLSACLSVMLIGERPGLTVADSLSIYMTFEPRRGRTDAERNCISNIHGAGGLSYHEASAKAAWIMKTARDIGVTGVALKESSADEIIAII
jgi:ethanolamine ammonia-lyase small subunit